MLSQAEAQRQKEADDNNPILQDIRKHSRDKLATWASDTTDLFEMADLTEEQCFSTIVSELLHMSVKIIGMIAPEMTPDDFGRTMKRSLEIYLEEKSNRRK